MTEDEKIRIKQLRNSGAGYKRIAAEMDLSVNTIKAFCKRTEESIDDGDPNDLGTAESIRGSVSSDNHSCLNCGAFIEQPKHGRRKRFCSDKCRTAYWRSHPETMKSSRKHICKCCGKVFYNSRNDSKYCSIDCYMAYRFGGVRFDEKQD